MSKKICVAFHAFDIGPSKNLSLISNSALKNGHRVKAVFNQALGNCELIDQATDILVTGISSFKPFDEVALGHIARSLGIPWVAIADTHGTCVRPAVKDMVRQAIAVVASPAEIEAAEEFGYQSAHYLDGPPDWYDFYRPEPKTFDFLPAGKTKNILVGGIKDALITDDMLTAINNAVKTLKLDCRIIFKPHPNEDPRTMDEKRRQTLLNELPIFDCKPRLDDLLVWADLSIHTCGATATIKAACARRPVIYFENEAVRQRLQDQIGVPDWFPASSGACALAGPESMTETIALLLKNEGFEALQSAQSAVYPTPNPKEPRPEDRIVAFLEKLTE